MKSLVLYAILTALGGVTAAHVDRHDGKRVSTLRPFAFSPSFSFQRETSDDSSSSSIDPRRTMPRRASPGWWQAPVLIPRGGSSSSGLQDLTVPNVVLALRWTGEVNRQLEQSGAAVVASRRTRIVSSRGVKEEEEEAEALAQQRYDTLRGGARIGLAVEASHRIRSADAAAAPATMQQPALTIYHTRSPRTTAGENQQPRGAAAWGPDLELYLSYLVQAFGLSDDNGNPSFTSLALNLALVYLDRSSSVETPRSNGASPCPFVTPRTVHRLLLASLAVAAHVVTGQSIRVLHAQVGPTLGVPYEQFVDLVAHMLAALGDLKTFVTPQQLHHVQALIPEGPSSTTIIRRGPARTSAEAAASAATASSLPPPPPPPPPRQSVKRGEMVAALDDNDNDEAASSDSWPSYWQPRSHAVRAHSS